MMRLLAVALAASGLAAPALAHVTVQPVAAVAGSYVEARFTVPHGCNGSPTVVVRIKIPDGVTSAKPQMKPGWEVAIKTRKLDPPIQDHGRTIGETVDEVEWRGGKLPDTLYDTFGLVVKLPDTPDATLYFPAVQECEQGVVRWIGIPAPGQSRGDLREPAPALGLTAKPR
jgi:periplasmic copper chaperone A